MYQNTECTLGNMNELTPSERTVPADIVEVLNYDVLSIFSIISLRNTHLNRR